MKPKLTLILALISLLAFSQNKPGSKKIGKAAEVQNMVTTLKGDTCLNKKFSLVFYLIQDTLNPITSTNLAAIVSADITPLVNTLNSKFSRICVSFEHCKTEIIPNYMHNVWDVPSETYVTGNWYMEKTINIYCPNKKILNATCPGGYTYLPEATSENSKKNLIVSNLSITGMLHLMGHFFGLPHTHDEINPTLPVSPSPSNTLINSKEFVNRSNCYLHGDGFCDTEADPIPVGGVAPYQRGTCGYDGGVQDGNGDFYIPPVENYMSFYLCPCRYTQEQYNFMAYKIITQRLYLH